MGKKAWGDPEKAGTLLKRISTGRFAEMFEAANLILYLLSDESTMINGAIVRLKHLNLLSVGSKVFLYLGSS